MKINFPILDEPIEISGGTILAVENVTVFQILLDNCILTQKKVS